jgi:hypothetical protein
VKQMAAPNTKIAAHTKWSKGGGGNYPTRFVVLKWLGPGRAHKYSSHEQVKDGINDDYFIAGHYHGTFRGAFADMKKRTLNRNENYGPGAYDHIPQGLNGITVIVLPKER